MNLGPCQRHPTVNTVYLRLAVVAPQISEILRKFELIAV